MSKLHALRSQLLALVLVLGAVSSAWGAFDWSQCPDLLLRASVTELRPPSAADALTPQFQRKLDALGLRLDVLSPEDAPKLIAFLHEQFKYASNNSEYLDIEPHFTKVASAGRKKNYQYWILKNEAGEIVAGTGLTPADRFDAKRVWHIDWFAVSTKYRGHGLGKALLLIAERRAIELGIEWLNVYTSTSPEESSANQLYESLGY